MGDINGGWRLQLLGEFRLTAPSGEAAGAQLGKPDRALLAYLVLSRRERPSRAKIAALLWPDRLLALNSLRTSLNSLRGALGDKDGQVIVPKSEPLICHFEPFQVDVLEFERLSMREDLEALERAELLYGGDLLADIEVRSERFCEWLRKERERLRGLAVGCLTRLLRLRLKLGLSQATFATAQRILSLDSNCQEAHRAVVELSLREGSAASARIYAQTCKDALLGGNIELEPATRAILRDVLEDNSRGITANQEPIGDDKARVTRKLAAILAADVAGYSQHMKRDEVGTFERLRKHRKELFEPAITKHNGRVFKLMGDGLLAEFDSSVNAVECAIVLQRGMAERNAAVVEGHRIDVRIGIHSCDVIIDDEDRYGDGVNIAARLQEQARPGNICVSHAVWENVAGKVPASFDYLGLRRVKNMAEPLGVYGVRLDGHIPQRRKRSQHTQTVRQYWVAAITLAVLVVVGGAATHWLWPKQQPPDRTSVAVLPFQSDGDRDRARLADGLSADITDSLAHDSDLFVIAHYSMEKYGVKPVDPSVIAHDLGVQYLVQGSIESFGAGVRVKISLIDTATGGQVWSDRLDQPILDNLPTTEDQITGQVAGRLLGYGGPIGEDRVKKLSRKPPANFSAYDYYRLAMQALRVPTEDNVTRADGLLRQALIKDDNFARAYVGLAWIAQLRISHGSSNSEEQLNELRTEMGEDVSHALERDPNDGEAHAAFGTYLTDKGDDRADDEFQKAVELVPNDADILLWYGASLPKLGEPDLGVEKVERAAKLNPNFPHWYNIGFRIAYYFHRDFPKSQKAAEALGCSTLNDCAWLAVIHAERGQTAAAKDDVSEVNKRDGDWSAQRRISEFGNFARPDEPLLFVDGARLANLNVCASDPQWKDWPNMQPIRLKAPRKGWQPPTYVCPKKIH